MIFQMTFNHNILEHRQDKLLEHIVHPFPLTKSQQLQFKFILDFHY